MAPRYAWLCECQIALGAKRFCRGNATPARLLNSWVASSTASVLFKHDAGNGPRIADLRTAILALRQATRYVTEFYDQFLDQSEAGRGATANDVNMLVCTGGRQRSDAEFQSLYAAAGLRLSRIISTELPYASIIEGVPG